MTVQTLRRAVSFAYVATEVSSRTTTIAMKYMQAALNNTIAGLYDQNYDQSLAFFRRWFEIAQTHSTIPPDAVLRALQTYRSKSVTANYIHPTGHLILRFASDAESDHILAPYSAGLQSRLCTEILQLFFDTDLGVVSGKCDWSDPYCADVSLVAHCINLGWVEEAVIRNQILQSLISHPTLHNHQVYALVILFQIAGATLAAYGDPTVVDRCFELLKGPRGSSWPRGELIQVSMPL